MQRWKHTRIHKRTEAPSQIDKENWVKFLRMEPNHEEYFWTIEPSKLNPLPPVFRSEMTEFGFLLCFIKHKVVAPFKHIVKMIKSSSPFQICNHRDVEVGFSATHLFVAHSFTASPLFSWSNVVSTEKYCMD